MKTEQRIFLYTAEYPKWVADGLKALVEKGYHIDSVSTTVNGSNLHQIDAIVVASIAVEDGN